MALEKSINRISDHIMVPSPQNSSPIPRGGNKKRSTVLSNASSLSSVVEDDRINELSLDTMYKV